MGENWRALAEHWDEAVALVDSAEQAPAQRELAQAKLDELLMR